MNEGVFDEWKAWWKVLEVSPSPHVCSSNDVLMNIKWPRGLCLNKPPQEALHTVAAHGQLNAPAPRGATAPVVALQAGDRCPKAA